MMDDATNMPTPVTRGELKAELEQFEIRLEMRLEQKLEQKLDQKLEQLEIRLEQKLDQKMDQKIERLEQKLDERLGLWGGGLLAQIQASERRVLAELARHLRAFQEAMLTQVSAIDDKYADLPARVTQLEATVFQPKRR